MPADRDGSLGQQHRQLMVMLEPESGVDDEERDRLARQLRTELTELDIESVTSIGGDRAPFGSKGADTWGNLLVTLSASGGVFTTVLVTVQEWLRRHRGEHQVKLIMDGDTLELSAASTGQQAELVRAFMDKHSGT